MAPCKPHKRKKRQKTVSEEAYCNGVPVLGFLVGGWTFQPLLKKYESKWVHLPQVGVIIKNIWKHHPGFYCFAGPLIRPMVAGSSISPSPILAMTPRHPMHWCVSVYVSPAQNTQMYIDRIYIEHLRYKIYKSPCPGLKHDPKQYLLTTWKLQNHSPHTVEGKEISFNLTGPEGWKNLNCT